MLVHKGLTGFSYPEYRYKVLCNYNIELIGDISRQGNTTFVS